MSRYINADRVHRDCEMRFADTGVPYEWAYALTIIDQAPTADVSPVVHGRWNEINQIATGLPWKYRCNDCGCPQEYKHNYCPNCGAKMDGERKDNKNG